MIDPVNNAYREMADLRPNIDWDGILIILGCVAFSFLLLSGAKL